uniref:cell adhesion molecule 2-like n=1 Tax=Myxine glutinosa TaxID=7769 RepID=UPI00358DE565
MTTMLFLLLCTASLAQGQLRAWASSNGSVVAGHEARLTCQVDHPDGSPIEWSNPAQQTLYFDNKKGLKDVRVSLVVQTREELTISLANTSLADDGVYTCIFFSKTMRLANTTLTVLVPPQPPVVSGAPKVVREKELLQLDCHAAGGRPPPILRWLRGGQEVSGESWEERDEDGVLVLWRNVEFTATPDDDGRPIICQMEHPALLHPLRAQQTIEVHYKPRVSIWSADMPLREGDRLELICYTNSNPSPGSLQWMRIGGDVPDRANVSGNHLVIISLNKTDNGTYRCQANNSLGSSSQDFQLVVLDVVPLTSRGDYALVGGIVAVVVFASLCLLVILGRYLARHKAFYPMHVKGKAEKCK